MPVTINASTSSGLVQTADTSGEISLQSNGTTVLGITSTGIAVTGTQSVSGNLSFNSGYGSSAVAYGCRAWVNFNGTGTVAINASGNVSSITDGGTADYTVNFTVSMPNTNYAVVTGTRLPTSNAVGCLSPVTYNTGSVRVLGSGEISSGGLFYVGQNFNTDHNICSVAVFR
jgi:hypothetical protein